MKRLYILALLSSVAFAQTDNPEAFQFFDIESLLEQQNGRTYQRFLDAPTLSTGLFLLPAGATDRQSPHTEDEVYYIIAGQASIEVDGTNQAVEAGSVIFVGAGVPHRFHSIEEDLTILVFFSSAQP